VSDSDLIRVPGQLGPFRLLRRIGYGGTGQVFEAEAYGASGFTKRVAIKTLLPPFIGDPEYERLFIREARIGAALFHPNLVQIHDFGVDDGIQWMRLDLVDGQNLAEFRGDEPLRVADAARIAIDVAAALHYLHRCEDASGSPLGLVYRDLKPSNVLISKSGVVRLTDFGIAKATALADVTRGNVRRGTYPYMSPEQVRGEPLTPASDVFALGTLLAELVLGRNPFHAATALAVGDRIRDADARGLDELPPELRSIVRRCLEPRARDRFGSAEELGLALSNVVTFDRAPFRPRP